MHDECLTSYPHEDTDPTTARLLAHWNPPLVGAVKINVDGSFLENSSRLGAGGVIRNHDGHWIASFTHFEIGGDALLAELRGIELGLKLCCELATKTLYVNAIAWVQNYLSQILSRNLSTTMQQLC